MTTLSAGGLLASDLGEQKIWKSADGREISARILELDPDEETVKMRRSDGLVFSIGFDRFEKADAARLRQAAKEQVEEAKQKSDASRSEKPERKPLPEKFELKDVPMVRQKGNFCVPASAAMIAGFHGIDTDQDQIAFLSSAGSFNNQGTNPRDMFLAMKKLGFDGKALYWRKPGDFHKSVLPAIRRALVDEGPIYISFKAGVFGASGHGCIIIGYHDRKEELIFHNPWGNVFEKE
ncbi:MAG TPA: papain-like cysteine protease family protein, partial [Opitutales bacterium]|nr:papain-like cysteine protease family protein [Opitutales bacterium]